MKIKAAIYALILTIMCFALFLISSPLYNDTDNLVVSMVVNGLYSRNNYCQYIHPLMCFIVGIFTHSFPTTDVYTLTIHLFLVIELFVFSFIAITIWMNKEKRNLSDHLELAMLLLFIIFLSVCINIWNANYTIQTAFFIFGGMLILTTEQKKAWSICGTVLVAFGFLQRIEAAILFFPYMSLKIFMLLMENKKRSEILRHFLPCLVITIFLLISRSVFYSFEPYRTALAYSNSRTTLVDYPTYSWGEIVDIPDGIVQEDYSAAKSWVLADTNIINANSLSRMAAAGKRPAFLLDGKNESMAKATMKILAAMWKRLTGTNLQMLLLFLIYLLLAIASLICGSRLRKIETILVFLGSFAILFYFTYSGRAPMRVWIPVLLAACMVMISNVLEYIKYTVGTLSILLICAVLWFGIGQAVIYFDFHMPMTAVNSISNDDNEDNPYTKFSENEIRIWSNWQSKLPHYYCSIGKLPTRDVLEHNIPIGAWVYGQPYFDDFLERLNVRNPAVALLERPDTYLMEEYNDSFICFIRKHYGDDIDVEENGDVAGIKKYKVVYEE